MIGKTWHLIPDHYPGIKLDVVQIMPNHLHGIIVVREVGTDLCACPFSMPGNARAQRPAATASALISLLPDPLLL
jgi:putative transposase